MKEREAVAAEQQLAGPAAARQQCLAAGQAALRQAALPQVVATAAAPRDQAVEGHVALP